jgi:hypothetical protein
MASSPKTSGQSDAGWVCRVQAAPLIGRSDLARADFATPHGKRKAAGSPQARSASPRLARQAAISR